MDADVPSEKGHALGQIVAVVIRPWLWVTALRLAIRTYPWPPEWRAFRAQTYGVESLAAIPPRDVVAYLRWCRRYPRALHIGSEAAAPPGV